MKFADFSSGAITRSSLQLNVPLCLNLNLSHVSVGPARKSILSLTLNTPPIHQISTINASGLPASSPVFIPCRHIGFALEKP
jgi:hypothetical protein